MILHHFFQDVHVLSHFLVARQMNSVCLDLPVAESGCVQGLCRLFSESLLLPFFCYCRIISSFSCLTGAFSPFDPFPDVVCFPNSLQGWYVEYAIIDEAVPYGATQHSNDHSTSDS